MTDHIGAFDRLYSKLASFDNVAVNLSNFSSITSQAITISKTSPLLNITDQASLNTFSLAVAGISGDFFTDSQSGDVIIKSQSPNKRLLFGSGPTSDIIFDGGIKVNGGSGPTGWSSLFSNIGTGNNSGLTVGGGFNFGWNVSGGDGENIMTYFTGEGVNTSLDICSWDGTTRTPTLSINASGGVTFGSNLYPINSGTNNQVLTTNGSGTLSWQSVAGSGGGTVNSVALSAPSFLTVANSPVTSSGTLTLTYSGTPLPVLNGGTGVTTSTGTGSLVLNTNPTILGTINTPQITGSGTSGDITINSSRDMGLTVSRNLGITSTTGEITLTGTTFVTVPQTFRASGVITAAVNSTNQYFNGTVIGDKAIRSDNNLWIGTPIDQGPRILNLVATSGIFANGRRLDVTNFGIYEGTSPLPDSIWTPYIPPNELETTGEPLSFNPLNGRFTNQTGFKVVVTANYSLKRESNGFGQTLFRIALDNGFFVARNTVSALDESTGSFQFVLNDQDAFVYQGFQNSGSGNNFSSSCIVSYTYRRS